MRPPLSGKRVGHSIFKSETKITMNNRSGKEVEKEDGKVGAREGEGRKGKGGKGMGGEGEARRIGKKKHARRRKK